MDRNRHQLNVRGPGDSSIITKSTGVDYSKVSWTAEGKAATARVENEDRKRAIEEKKIAMEEVKPMEFRKPMTTDNNENWLKVINDSETDEEKKVDELKEKSESDLPDWAKVPKKNEPEQNETSTHTVDLDDSEDVADDPLISAIENDMDSILEGGEFESEEDIAELEPEVLSEEETTEEPVEEEIVDEAPEPEDEEDSNKKVFVDELKKVIDESAGQLKDPEATEVEEEEVEIILDPDMDPYPEEDITAYLEISKTVEKVVNKEISELEFYDTMLRIVINQDCNSHTIEAVTQLKELAEDADDGSILNPSMCVQSAVTVQYLIFK